MDATPHLVVGAALGRKMHPVLALAVGVLSNAAIDYIPHTNYTGWQPFTTAMVVDVLIGGMLVMAIAALAPRPYGAWAGALGGALPEIERIVTGYAKDFLGRPPFSIPQTEIGPPLGYVTQAAVVALALLFALRREPAQREMDTNDGDPADG